MIVGNLLPYAAGFTRDNERSGFPTADLRHHLAPRRGQDDAHREAAALRRRHPARRRGEGPRRGAARALGLDEGRAGARHLRHRLGDDLRVRRLHLQPARHARHEDFSEDTYRTLTAVDSAVMVIDAAKGIEAQTRKLFEVCRLRDVPIITFVNKLDREGRDPFDLMSEIEQDLQLHVTPAAWPIGMGQSFLGCYDLRHERLVLMDKSRGATVREGEVCEGLDDPKLDARLPADALARLRDRSEAR